MILITTNDTCVPRTKKDNKDWHMSQWGCWDFMDDKICIKEQFSENFKKWNFSQLGGKCSRYSPFQVSLRRAGRNLK